MELAKKLVELQERAIAGPCRQIDLETSILFGLTALPRKALQYTNSIVAAASLTGGRWVVACSRGKCIATVKSDRKKFSFAHQHPAIALYCAALRAAEQARP